MSLKSNQSKQSKDIIQKAYEKGITFFDTADLYDKGLNEMIVGESVQSFRKHIVLASKVGNLWRADDQVGIGRLQRTILSRLWKVPCHV